VVIAEGFETQAFELCYKESSARAQTVEKSSIYNPDGRLWYVTRHCMRVVVIRAAREHQELI
jgi:hypothetical protein